MLLPITIVPFDSRNGDCSTPSLGSTAPREIREYFIPDFSNWKDPD